MKISRREFIGTIGAAAVSSALPAIAKAEETKNPIIYEDKFKGAKVTTSICPFCAVGCGMLVYQKDGKVIGIEGDPEHPINEGSLCSKGNSLFQILNNERHIKKVLYRASGSAKWEEKSWEWAIPEIAKRVKKTRDANFIQKEGGKTVNRTEGIVSLGGASLDNEECYLLSKLMRSLGLCFIEHQASL